MKKVLLAFIIACLSSAAAFCGPYEFGISLFEEGDYYRAIGEFKRYVFENPKGARVFEARYREALSYLYAGKNSEAAGLFEKLARSEKGLKSEICALQAVRAYQEKKDYKFAGNTLRQLVSEQGARLLKDETVYMLGWNAFLEKDFTLAEESFKKLKGGRLEGAAQDALAALAERDKVEQKSGLVAGILGAVLPGAGHFYCGKIVEGFSSLLITGLLAYNTYEGIRNNDQPKIWLYGIPAVTFYGSSVYGAVNAAARFNEAAMNSYLGGAAAARAEVLEINF